MLYKTYIISERALDEKIEKKKFFSCLAWRMFRFRLFNRKPIRRKKKKKSTKTRLKVKLFINKFGHYTVSPMYYKRFKFG